MQPPDKDNEQTATLSIGAVSKATGIPVDTLRTWERRYGFPQPQRAPSGHRKYSPAIIPHLDLITEALERGHRPANIVGESLETLRALLDLTDSARLEPEPAADASRPPNVVGGAKALSPSTQDEILSQWYDAMVRLDAATLRHSFESIWFKLGPLTFLSQLVSPFLKRVGEAWFSGEIAVLHEQFASNQLREFLVEHWRPMSERARGPRVICAALPGEYHAIGLHMIAVVMVLAGCQIIFLGSDTPVETIAEAARQNNAEAVLVSVSQAANHALTSRQLRALEDQLDASTALLVGGAGAPAELARAVRLESLEMLHDWATANLLRAR